MSLKRIIVSTLFIAIVTFLANSQPPKKVMILGTEHLLFEKIVDYLAKSEKNGNLVYDVLNFNKELRKDSLYINLNGSITNRPGISNTGIASSSEQLISDVENFLLHSKSQDLYITVKVSENDQFYMINVVLDQDINFTGQFIYLMGQNSSDHVFYLNKNDQVLTNLERELRKIFPEINYPPESSFTINSSTYSSIQKPIFNIYSPIEIDARNSIDREGDPLQFQHILTGPQTDIIKTNPFFSFSLQNEGEYQYTLLVSDGIDTSKTQQSFFIANKKSWQLPAFSIEKLNVIPLLKKDKSSSISIKINNKINEFPEIAPRLKYFTEQTGSGLIREGELVLIKQKDAESEYKIPLRTNNDLIERYQKFTIKYFAEDSEGRVLGDTSVIQATEQNLRFISFGVQHHIWNINRDTNNFYLRKFNFTSLQLQIALTNRFSLFIAPIIRATEISKDEGNIISQAFTAGILYNSNYKLILSKSVQSKKGAFLPRNINFLSTLAIHKFISNGTVNKQTSFGIKAESSPRNLLLFELGAGLEVFFMPYISFRIQGAGLLNNKLRFKHGYSSSLSLMYRI